jgi:pimeloyl-ACP methyl ester carboxylesterase
MVLALRGRGEGRPSVLLPWFGLDAGVTALAFESIFSSTAPWRRIYLDLPGQGKSPAVAANSDAVLNAVAETIESVLGAEASASAWVGLRAHDGQRAEAIAQVVVIPDDVVGEPIG